jgi:hypothetical protein
MAAEMEYLVNHPWQFGFLLAILLSISIEIGYRVALRSHIAENPDREEQVVAIRDGLFVLVSLLLGFTLALAAPRFAERRSLLVDEAVSIGTTYLRAGTLPQPYHDHSQQLLRQYIEARIDLDNAGLDATRITAASNLSKRIHHQLWADVLAVSQTDRTAITAAYVNSLNETFDLHEKRVAALENRIPYSIWMLIIFVSLITVFARGLTLTRRFWLTLVLIPLTIAIVVALTDDLDTPSAGLIRLDQRAMQRLASDLGALAER